MQKIRAAINGYGRIGRAILRAVYSQQTKPCPIQIVAINGFGALAVNAHLTQYDSVHGRFLGLVETTKSGLLINHQDDIQFFSESDPRQLPWEALGIDVVYECTGRFTDRGSMAYHLQAGAKRVLISAPAKFADITVVYGVNHDLLKQSNYHIVSAASCTTNALAVVIKPIEEMLGIKQGTITTIHAYTSDQRLLDNHHTDLYRARAATQSIIPTKTGVAETIGVIFPALQGKLRGLAVRVPTPNVSLLDINLNIMTPADAMIVNQTLCSASTTTLKGILKCTKEPLVSSDFNHDLASAVVLSQEIIVIGNLVKILAWYDNEWGFANRMLDITISWFS
jgi:glyceraldehyde 3-phosphate dehydrogenase